QPWGWPQLSSDREARFLWSRGSRNTGSGDAARYAWVGRESDHKKWHPPHHLWNYIEPSVHTGYGQSCGRSDSEEPAGKPIGECLGWPASPLAAEVAFRHVSAGHDLCYDPERFAPMMEDVLMPVSQIQHVFVLMLENRSFDHMLGFSGLTGNDAVTGTPTAIQGLTGNETNTFN